MTKRFINRLMIKEREVSLGLTLIGYKSEGVFVLYTPALDLYSSADSEEEVFVAFDETVHLYIDHVIVEDTLEKDLKRLGWEKHTYFKKRFDSPKYDPREIMSSIGVNSFNLIDKQLALQA